MSTTNSLQISKKSLLITVITLFSIMILVGLIAQFVPTGAYSRIEVDGVEQVDYSSFSYTNVESLKLYRIFTAPFEVFGSKYIVNVIGIFYFIMAIGATFSVLEKSGVIHYLLMKIIKRYQNNKYKLLRIIILFFMLFGSVFGIFEEVIALVPILIALAFMIGYDTMVGLGISVFATGVGFASATFNPFTLGVAQNLAEVPLYSGILFRIVVFIVMYLITAFFIIRYAKKLERNPQKSLTYSEDLAVKSNFKLDLNLKFNPVLETAIKVFYGFLLTILLFIMLGFFVKVISDILLLIIATLFLIAGIVVGKVSQYTNTLTKDLLKGMALLLPGIVLMILAVSITYLLEEAQIMDTILYHAADFIGNYNQYVAITLIFLLVMIINFFIPGGSSKAFLVMPIITPLATIIGISSQTVVQAFLFGDGFSNIFFVSNPILMICLGLSVASYKKWVIWTFKIQAMLFVVSCLFLYLAVAIGY